VLLITPSRKKVVYYLTTGGNSLPLPTEKRGKLVLFVEGKKRELTYQSTGSNPAIVNGKRSLIILFWLKKT